MSIKVRLNPKKKALLEQEMADNMNDIKEEISELWREIRSKTDPLGRMQKDLVNNRGGITQQFADISELERLQSTRDGRIINPKAIKYEANDIINNEIQKYSSAFPGLKQILSYWKYPIIWTAAIDTACTDGLRIAFNPFFYAEITEMAMDAYNRKHGNDPETVQGNLRKNLTRMIPFIFVMVHEAYHQIYRHIAREAIATFVDKTAQGHADANYAQDAEINRDIIYHDFTFLKSGCDIIGGIDETSKFPTEDWEDIYKAFKEGKEKPSDPNYFNNNPEQNSDPDAQPQWGDGEGQPQEVEMSDEFNKGYRETYNRLVDIWNQTHDVNEVSKEAQRIQAELGLN